MTRDEIETLEQALREASPPDEGAARERARRTVLSAHADARPRRRFTRSAPVVWLTAAAFLAVVLVIGRDTGPARAFENLVRDIVHVPAATPEPATVNRLALPAPGRLLVTGSDGLFAVARDGRRTPLGRWQAATWSPTGLYVAATSGRTLAALDPDNGTVRWRLRPGGAVAFPRWAPDRTHIAYRAGTHAADRLRQRHPRRPRRPPDGRRSSRLASRRAAHDRLGGERRQGHRRGRRHREGAVDAPRRRAGPSGWPGPPTAAAC